MFPTWLGEVIYYNLHRLNRQPSVWGLVNSMTVYLYIYIITIFNNIFN